MIQLTFRWPHRIGDERFGHRTSAYPQSAPSVVDFSAVGALVECLPVMHVPEMKLAYLQIRNENWLKTIHKAVQSPRRILIVVTVAHLYGSGNLIELYRKEFGICIKPV
jgi:TraB/PrgY/gumN family